MELAKYDYIQAAVLLHPSFVTLEDIHGMNSIVNYILHYFCFVLRVAISKLIFIEIFSFGTTI